MKLMYAGQFPRADTPAGTAMAGMRARFAGSTSACAAFATFTVPGATGGFSMCGGMFCMRTMRAASSGSGASMLFRGMRRRVGLSMRCGISLLGRHLDRRKDGKDSQNCQGLRIQRQLS